MTFDIDTIAAALDDDGDSIEIPSENGTWTFRLRIGPDDGLSYEDMEDPEVFGKVAYIDHRRSYDGGPRRPDGFTGAARILSSESSQGDRFWYEPPEYLRRFKGSGFTDFYEWLEAGRKHAANVRSIVSWGYNYVQITAEHRLPDGYHREWANSTGGIEAEADRAYLDSVFHDVLNELIGEIS